MTDTAALSVLTSSTDTELLSLYLSLAPADREKTFIGTAQAARITGVSVRTVQLWIECGALRAILVGSKYRILLESLKAHLERQIEKRA